MRANGSRRGDEGSGGMVGLIIGLVLFSLVFGYLMSAMLSKRSETQDSTQTSHQAQANALADILFGTGSGWYGSQPCTADHALNTDAYDPDAFSDPAASPTNRFGLGDESCSRSQTDPRSTNNLSFAKISNLFNAQTEADGSNGYVDYEEARHSLGLDASGLQFHIRSAPVLSSVRDVLRHGTRDATLRPLYLADYDSTVSTSDRPNIAHSGSAQQDAHYVYLNVTITQVVPTIASNFQVGYSIPLERGTVTFTKNTISVAAGSVIVSAQLAKTKDWDWANDLNKVATYEISDPLGELATGTIGMSSVSPQSPANDQNNLIVTLSMDRLTYAAPFAGSNKWPEVDYVAYKGDGSASSSFDGDDLDVKVVGTGLLPYTKLYADPSKSGQSLQDVLLVVGTYTVEAWVPNVLLGKKVTTDTFQIITPVLGADPCNVDVGDYAPQASVGPESGYLATLFENYEEGVALSNYHAAAMPYAAGGDVFPDVKCAVNQHLAGLLTDADGNPSTSTYTTLVVGSNVDHTAMTSGAAKNTIRDWVLTGGTLIVFGSNDQSVQWLQPLFHSSIDSASGGLYTPDESHPVLAVPNDLDYTGYQYTTEWDYGAGADDLFTHVITTGGESDVLALSDPGAFGEGKVLLTSWRPYDLTPDQATLCPEPITEETQCQALFLLHNLVTQSYRELFLDYGPALPLDRSVSVSTRIVSTYHPELEQLLGLEVQVFVFAG